ncbi:50S ribosomal protein L18 [Candidatus Gottesmanbacteria bacterium]|nr:50S ribosomal protein L18 [Candidatus Gottesmanbacteria bacterium]
MNRPRLSVFRSGKYIYGQIIDDKKGETLVAANDQKWTRSKIATPAEGGIKIKNEKLKKTERAKEVGKILADKALKKGIKTIVFDRGTYKYHGRVKALAEGARDGGLKF